jgi:diguanylate cyclase (GGDEF)-like protein
MGNKILIVDDEAHMRELLRYNFKKEGYEVEIASNGIEGIDVVKKDRPDLIISDVMMPKMDGIEFCKTLRGRPESEAIPFIFLTAKGQLPDKIAGLRIGADDYITKPFIPKELIEMVNTRMKRVKVYKEGSEIDELTGIYNRKFMKERLASDLDKAGRLGLPLALGFIDVDAFGKVNDKYGHPVGDVVLKSLAESLSKSIKEDHALARYGGEEFVAIMLATAREEALRLMEEARARVENTKFSHEGKELDLKVTVSIGVSFYPEDAQDPDGLISCADKALFTAKNRGRNRVAVLSENE